MTTPGPAAGEPSAVSVSAVRTSQVDGVVRLRERPLSAAGCLLGLALLADSSPASTHDHADGERLVTASLSVQMPRAVVADPPAQARIQRGPGAWPFVTGLATIDDLSGSAIAASHTVFVGLDRSGGHMPRGNGQVGDGIRPSLDDVADSIVQALRKDNGPRNAGRIRTSVVLDARLRNRYGVVHGASIFTVLALLAQELGPASGGWILDSHVRFLRPVRDDDVIVEGDAIARSRRLTDCTARLSSPDGGLLATGTFTLATL